MRERIHVGVIGAGDTTQEIEDLAIEVGRGVAERGGVVVCGGLGGVMAGACRGARSVGGTTIGLLPGSDRHRANPWVDVAIPTGMGEVRNVLVVRASDVLIAVSGAHGTLSEIAFALRLGKPVVGLRSWTLTAGDAEAPDPGIAVVETAQAAVAEAFRATGPGVRRPPSPA